MRFQIPLDRDFSFNLGIHKFACKYVDPALLAELELNGAEPSEDEEAGFLYGLWAADHNTIYVNNTLTDEMKCSTVCHEMIHIFESVMGLTLSHKDLNIIGECFAQVLIGSPELNLKY